MSRRTYVLLIALLMASTITANAQTGVTVDGRVVDERTGLPLPGITLTLGSEQVHRTAITDSTGEYYFTEVPPGTYSLAIDPSRIRAVFKRVIVADQPLHLPDLRTQTKIEVKGRVEPVGWQNLMVTAQRSSETQVVSVMPDGIFVLWLEEGEYRVSVNIPGTHVVKSISFGSLDLLKAPLMVHQNLTGEISIVIAEK